MVRSAQLSAERLLSEALKVRPAINCSMARAVGASDPPHTRKLASPGCATIGLVCPVEDADGSGVPHGMAAVRSPSALA